MPKSKKRILIVANTDKDGVIEQVETLKSWFERYVEITAILPSDQLPGCKLEPADLCVVFGGDGTLLAAARAIAATGTPLLGVNMGKLGFLAEFNVEHLQKHFERIVGGKVQPVERMMLDVRVNGCKKHDFTSLAVNEMAISAGQPFRVIDISVSRGSCHIANYLSDGLVICTPTGSTGYNMSAGGPILEPTIDALAITPVAPHMLSMRPIVVRPEEVISVTVVRGNPGTTISVDGQVNSSLCDGDIIEVRRAEVSAKIFSHPGRPFFQTLTDKLHWGRSPHHG